MSIHLSQKIVAAVDAASPPELVSADDGGLRLSLNLIASGPVGLAFDRLEFQSPGPDRTAENLRDWADKLASQVTYLMEPLVVLEIDAVAGEVELRSQSPTPRGQLKSYYEVRLTKIGTMTISRIVYDSTTRRRSVTPCQVTREVLERLTDDIVACAA